MSLIESAIAPSEVTGDLLQLLYIPLSALVNLDEVLTKGNPKRHEIDKLRESIIQNGFIDPAKWDANLNSGKGGIIYGNGRTEAPVAMLLDMKGAGQSPPRGIGIHSSTGEWCTPVKFGVDAESETAAKRFIVDHNLLTASGLSVVDASAMFKTEAYLELLGKLKEQDALPLTVNEEDYLALVGASGEEEGSSGSGDDEGEGDPTEVELREGLVLGSIWQLGRHRLMCGDSTDEGDVRKLLGNNIPDVIWSDPPYGMNCQKKDGRIGSRSTAAKNARDKKALDSNSVPKGATAYPIIAGDDDNSTAIKSFILCNQLFPEAQQIWWGANYYSECLPSTSGWVVWDKQNDGTDFADGELAWTNSSRSLRIFRWLWNGMVKQGEASNQKRVHPNQKPVEMVCWYWDKYALDAEIMFDPFLGGGTSIIAAEKQDNRTVFGIEYMPQYCEIILRRFSKTTGQEAVLIEPGFP